MRSHWRFYSSHTPHGENRKAKKKATTAIHLEWDGSNMKRIKYERKKHVQVALGLNYLLFRLLNIYTSLWFSFYFHRYHFCCCSYSENIFFYLLHYNSHCLTRHVKYLLLLLWILLSSTTTRGYESIEKSRKGKENT